MGKIKIQRIYKLITKKFGHHLTYMNFWFDEEFAAYSPTLWYERDDPEAYYFVIPNDIIGYLEDSETIKATITVNKIYNTRIESNADILEFFIYHEIGHFIDSKSKSNIKILISDLFNMLLCTIVPGQYLYRFVPSERTADKWAINQMGDKKIRRLIEQFLEGEME